MISRTLAPTRENPLPVLAVVALAFLALYVVGIDQGHLLALFQGNFAFDQNLLHEVMHDARHAAGFPCH